LSSVPAPRRPGGQLPERFPPVPGASNSEVQCPGQSGSGLFDCEPHYRALPSPKQGVPLIMLAYTYPLLSIFWTMLEFFLFFLWIWLLIIIFSDIFRSHDMGGLATAVWVIFVIILPFLGVLIYLIARGGSMHERAE